MKFKNSFFIMLMATTLFACNSQTTKTETETTSADSSIASHQNDSAMIKEEAVTYKDDTATLNGYIAYNENQQGIRPIVLVVPEWWGLNDYPRMRAKKLAELGYIAMAVDMYGNGKTAADPTQAQSMAMPFYTNPKMAKGRLDAALAKVKTYAQADSSQTAAIGYCFGGSVVLNAAKLGADLDGVVSFHGNLEGVPANKKLLKAKVLVCHGAADSFVPQSQVDAFKKSMDSIGADYTFKAYPNATHAFTNPAATATGKKFKMPIEYNAAADTASWNDMKAFFARIFK
jgi:dienelactone hydrolase